MLLRGCVSASLATNTGPKRPEERWSTAGRQRVHVGEEVQFDFLLLDGLGRFRVPAGVAHYVAVLNGEDRVEVAPDELGHSPG